jgi:phosphoheptose isomerase
MSDSTEILKRAAGAATKTLQSIVDLAPQVTSAADLIADALRAGNKLLVCGNGGSAADAADFCTEFACRFIEERRPYPALNLSQGGSLITAIGNDYGMAETFARQVRAFGKTGDLLIALSTSGKSPNIRRALEEGRTLKLKTIALLGRDGGSCAGLADVDIVIKAEATARIQEAHKFLLHVLCEMVEGRLPK